MFKIISHTIIQRFGVSLVLLVGLFFGVSSTWQQSAGAQESSHTSSATHAVHKHANGKTAKPVSVHIEKRSRAQIEAERAQAENLTPEEAFEADRSRYIKLIEMMRATNGDSKGQKLIDTLRPIALKYLRLPLKLQSKKDNGNSTHLVFAATEPGIDFVWGCDATRVGQQWVVGDFNFEGKLASQMGLEPFNAMMKAFPAETSTLTISCIVFVISAILCVVFSFWLIINAFRASIVWGLVSFVVPFGYLIFTAMRWREARQPFIAMALSWLVMAGSVMAMASVLDSFKGVTLPALMPADDPTTTELIRKGLENSPNVRLQQVGTPDQ